MAKHMVKCSICGETFDANENDYVKTHNGRRYAHTYCFEHQEELKTQDQKDREQLEAYIKILLNVEQLNPRIYKSINDYLKQYNYTYKGIFQALVYFYEVKGNDKSKANGSIGIVPYCYQDAFNYFLAMWEAQQKNEVKVINHYKPSVEEITIPRPQVKVTKRKLFSFLDEEEE